ncbi:MAG TPA: peptidylprolyl isomerase [Pyrinomonadaceae bacterium]|jgi:peptidyl-prolyl cis-trans isomerase C
MPSPTLGRRAAPTLFALAALFASCAKNPTPTPTNNPPAAAPRAAVATVDGRAIPVKFYEMFLRNGREALGIDEGTAEGRSALGQLREGIVAELIDRALVAEEGARRGLSVTDAMIDARVAKETNERGGEEKFRAFLGDHGLSREEYREIARDMIYGELLAGEAAKEATVADEEIKKYYDEHRGDAALRLPERIAASHILVAARASLLAEQLRREKNLAGDALAAAVREETARRRAKAEELRRRAAAGEDFARLARENSDDAATRERGGDLGTFARDAHARAFDEAAFALKVGGVSPVVETEYGFHVIKLARREAARAVTLDEAAPEIRQRLAAAKQARVLQGWLEAARARAQVRVAEGYRFGELKAKYPAM